MADSVAGRPVAELPGYAHVERVVIERTNGEYRIVVHVLGARQAITVQKARGGVRTWRHLDRAVQFAEQRWPGVSPYVLHLSAVVRSP